MFKSFIPGLSNHPKTPLAQQDHERAMAHERMLLALPDQLQRVLAKFVTNPEFIARDDAFLAQVHERAAEIRAIDGLPEEFVAELDALEQFSQNVCTGEPFSIHYGPVLYRHVDAKGGRLKHAKPIGSTDLMANTHFENSIKLTLPTAAMVRDHLDAGDATAMGLVDTAMVSMREVTLMVEAFPAGTPLGQVVRRAATLLAMCEEHERSTDHVADQGQFHCFSVLALEDRRHFEALSGCGYAVVLMENGQIVAHSLPLMNGVMHRTHRMLDAVTWPAKLKRNGEARAGARPMRPVAA